MRIRSRSWLSLLFVVVAAAATACAGSEDAQDPLDGLATPSESVETVTSTPTPPADERPSSPTPSPTVASSPSPPPDAIEAALTVWLVDVESRRVDTLIEADEGRPLFATFGSDGMPVVRTAIGDDIPDRRFDLDGQPIAETTPILPRCIPIDELRIAVDGEPFEASVGPIKCGLISPDHRWMLDDRDVVTALIGGIERPQSWDQWLIDLQSGEGVMLQQGLRHCGGCDGVFGPRWAPSGRYVYFAELVQDGDVYLASVDGTVRRLDVGTGGGLLRRPEWAATTDRLLYPDAAGNTVYEDLEAGTRIVLDDVPWPAAFDHTEQYIYSPAYETIRTGDPTPDETVVLELARLGQLAQRPGHPSASLLWGAPATPVFGVDDGFVAALEGASACDGVTVYRADGEQAACVIGGGAGVFSPDGTKLAIAVAIDRVPTVSGPGFSGGPVHRYEIRVLDLTAGTIETVAAGALSDDEPAIAWNEAGTHLLVTWPVFYGL